MVKTRLLASSPSASATASSISPFSLALLNERRLVPESPFQLPQMQIRRATVPFRHISPCIKGSLGDRISTCGKNDLSLLASRIV
jgi:hypothetical protein